MTRPTPPGAISDAERRIIELIACGWTRPQIAPHLHLSPDTVKTHLHRVNKRMRTQNAAHLVALLIRRGVLPTTVADTAVRAQRATTRRVRWAAPACRLTPRERDVLELLACGFTKEEVAERLPLSPATVRTYVTRARMRLRASNTAHLVAICIREGLLPVTVAGLVPPPGRGAPGGGDGS